MIFALLFILGTIIGSFLNVVALRLNSGLTLKGRSKCPHCGKTLRFYELVPVLSFLFLRGRCRECKAKLSWQYPMVELMTGAVFMSAFDPLLPLALNALVLAVFSLFIAIAVYDFHHKIIPDKLVLVSFALALAFRILFGGDLLDWLAGPIVASLFALIWLVSKGRAMGFGDAKLALPIGLLLGGAQGFSAAVLAFWIGAACGLAAMAFPLSKRGKQLTIKSEIPFAPFLILGAWLSWVFQSDLLHVAIF